jgi:hypothetical protein
MKLLRVLSLLLRGSLFAGCLVLLPALRGSDSGPSTARSGTNSIPAERIVPKSVFNLTNQPVKDPFFPLSMRQPFPVPSTNSARVVSASSFLLKGLSGPPEQRLAMINNRTLAAGEDAEISTASGKIKIRCVEIKEASAVIRVADRPGTVEVFLRKAAQ